MISKSKADDQLFDYCMVDLCFCLNCIYAIDRFSQDVAKSTVSSVVPDS